MRTPNLRDPCRLRIASNIKNRQSLTQNALVILKCLWLYYNYILQMQIQVDILDIYYIDSTVYQQTCTYIQQQPSFESKIFGCPNGKSFCSIKLPVTRKKTLIVHFCLLLKNCQALFQRSRSIYFQTKPFEEYIY